MANKHGVFFITSSDPNKSITVIPKTISTSVLQKVASIDSRIDSPRKRAMRAKDIAESVQKAIQLNQENPEGTKSEDQIYASIFGASEASAKALIQFIIHNDLSVEDVEQFLDANVISSKNDQHRIDIIKAVADTALMSSADFELLHHPADGFEDGAWCFWQEAEIGEVRATADYFRGLLRA